MLRRVKKHHWFLASVVAAVALIVNQNSFNSHKIQENLPLPEEFKANPSFLIHEKPTYQVAKITVKSGDTPETLLNPLGIPKLKIYTLVRQVPQLLKILPGYKLQIVYKGIQIKSLVVKVSDFKQWHIDYDPKKDHYSFKKVTLDYPRRLVFRKGQIERSLYLDGLAGGIEESVIGQLTNIFSWTIDFGRELRKDDRFALIYEQMWRKDHWEATQRIIAAVFDLQGTKHYAFYYAGNKKGKNAGYYDEKGQSLRKAFSRNPVKNVRITSRFSLGRMHPVLHKIRRHLGVDYGAPKGTPIYVTGDGIVIKKYHSPSYGNVIMVQHNRKYTTVYAHMSRYAKGIYKGKRVKQGQVIGYVGMTGLATGPHLHYEFRINGHHVDPLKVKFPATKPLKGADLKEFKPYAENLAQILDEFLQRVDFEKNFD